MYFFKTKEILPWLYTQLHVIPTYNGQKPKLLQSRRITSGDVYENRLRLKGIVQVLLTDIVSTKIMGYT